MFGYLDVWIIVQYGCRFHPPKHNSALCNSLRNLKTLKDHTMVPDPGHGPKYEYVV